MSKLLVIFFLIAFATLARSQDTPPVMNYPKPSDIKPVTPGPQFSARPTVTEIVDALQRSGQEGFEPLKLVQELAAHDASVIQPLAELLAADTLWAVPGPNDSLNQMGRIQILNRVLVIYTLDAMGSAESYALVAGLGAAHVESEIRGASLNVLSNSYFDKVQAGASKPDVELLHTLMRNVDDLTLVPTLQTSLAQIARGGILKWLGEDLGLPAPSGTRVSVSGQGDMTLREYREYWWDQNKSKIEWDSQEARFRLSE